MTGCVFTAAHLSMLASLCREPFDHAGRALYEAACGLDLEGIDAKRKDSRYVCTRTRSWLKIKNPNYSQAEGRRELFDRWNGHIPAWGSCDLEFDRMGVR
jgi:hypothetical protein